MKHRQIILLILVVLIAFSASIPVIAANQSEDPVVGGTACGDDGHVHNDDFVCNHNYHGDDFDCSKQIFYNPNHTSSAERRISPEESEKFVAEYKRITSDDELRQFIAKWLDIPLDEVDLELMRSQAAKTPPMTEEEKEKLLAEALEAGILPTSQRSEESLSDIAEGNGGQQSLMLGCDHHFITGPCTGNHYGEKDCQVWCVRQVLCMYGCGTGGVSSVRETNHSWSTGWCGRTCTKCGVIELFHPPGGCWYCS